MKVANFISRFSDYIFGFEYVKDKTHFSELLGGKDLTPIFTDKSESVVCLWNEEGYEKVVWIDSEGVPCNVFAEKIEDFFEILPLGPTFIWDYLSKHENYSRSPNPFRNPKTVFTLEYIHENYIDVIEDKDLFNDYCGWLKENNLEFNTNPIEKIGNVISNTNFSDWFTN